MTYEYKSHIYLAETVLNVKDLASQTAFYQQVIGLEILSQTETESILGLGEKVLVQLIQAQESGEVREHYGLYHLAILLPTRKALADVLKHLTDLQIPLVGGADHGYSEAIYLEDLEGNGIELYRDKPVSTWDIREDGRIIGVTEALAAVAQLRGVLWGELLFTADSLADLDQYDSRDWGSEAFNKALELSLASVHHL